MNFEVHLTLCIIFLFSTWVYFLKCEINELRQRLTDATGEHEVAEHAVQVEHAMAAATGVSAGSMAHAHVVVMDKGHDRKPEAANVPHHHVQQRSGIPTWTIE